MVTLIFNLVVAAFVGTISRKNKKEGRKSFRLYKRKR